MRVCVRVGGGVCIFARACVCVRVRVHMRVCARVIFFLDIVLG